MQLADAPALLGSTMALGEAASQTGALTIAWSWITERPHVPGFALVMIVVAVCVFRNPRKVSIVVGHAPELTMYVATMLGALVMLAKTIREPASLLGESTWPMVIGFWMLVAYAAPRLGEKLRLMWTGEASLAVQPTVEPVGPSATQAPSLVTPDEQPRSGTD